MTRRALQPLPSFVLILVLLLGACGSTAGTSPLGVPTTSATGVPGTTIVRPSTSSEGVEQIFELHYVRSTIAGRQSEHTATVRGAGDVEVVDELAGTEQQFTLTPTELARLRALLPVLTDAPEPTSVVSDVGRIDARIPVDGQEISVSVDDWSMAGGTARLPTDERVVADAMIELRDLLIKDPADGSTTATSTG